MTSAQAVLSGLDEQTTARHEALYMHLHQNPELSMQEHETSAEIARRLEEFGYEVQLIGGGVVGVLVNGPGMTVLFRADMDAMPVTEATGLPYASTKTVTDAAGSTVGVMHAYAHDAHVTCGLAAAELLARSRDAWSGTYIALFEPGEETAQGARSMVEDGLTHRVPRPDVAMAQHVLTSPPAGHVATAAGPVLSAGDSIRITVYGTGCHGSMPHLGVDPVVLAAAIVIRLQTIVSREIAPGEFGVVTIGSLQAGSRSNVIPDSAVLLLNVRTYDTAVRHAIVEAIERIVRAECMAARSPRDPDFEYYDQYPLTSNSSEVTEAVTTAFQTYFGDDRVHHLGRVPASEDFSIITDAFGTPYTYWGLGGVVPGTCDYPIHNPGFAPSIQPTLRTGTEAVVVAAMAYLGREASHHE